MTLILTNNADTPVEEQKQSKSTQQLQSSNHSWHNCANAWPTALIHSLIGLFRIAAGKERFCSNKKFFFDLTCVKNQRQKQIKADSKIIDRACKQQRGRA